MACATHLDKSSRSFKYCRLARWGLMDLTWLPHLTQARCAWEMGKLKAKSTPWTLYPVLQTFLKRFSSDRVHTSICKWLLPPASTIALKGCLWSSVASTCPSYIYMSSRSQVFTGEHHIATEGFALFPLCTLLRFLPQVSGDAEVYSLFVVSILIVNANAPFILKDEKIVDSSLLEAHSTACWIVDMY